MIFCRVSINNKKSMKKYKLLIAILAFNLNSCCAQQKQTTEKQPSSCSEIPCFYAEYPKIINLPDSFDFKKKNYYALFYVTAYLIRLVTYWKYCHSNYLLKTCLHS